jgi:hypothetical protein
MACGRHADRASARLAALTRAGSHGVAHREIARGNGGMIVSFRHEWLRAFFVDDVRSSTSRSISKAGSSASSR